MRCNTCGYPLLGKDLPSSCAHPNAPHLNYRVKGLRESVPYPAEVHPVVSPKASDPEPPPLPAVEAEEPVPAEPEKAPEQPRPLEKKKYK